MFVVAYPEKLIRSSLTIKVELDEYTHYLDRLSKECLHALTDSAVVQRSNDEISAVMFDKLVQFSHFIGSYTSAIEALDNFKVDVSLEDFKGEI